MYGSRGSGFSLGIDRQKFAKAIERQPEKYPAEGTKLTRVQYSEEDQMRHFRGLFDKCVNEYRAKKSESKGYAGLLAIDALRSASEFKHPCFKSECEWRVVTSPNPEDYRNLFFRPSTRTVIPYVKIPKVEQKDWKLPIVSITIGPTLHQGLSARSVAALLLAKGYSIKEVEIRSSELPLVLTG
jgi:hypothetical protein